MKSILCLSVFLFLAACGFTPVYYNSGATDVSSALQQVEIATIPDREGQTLRNALIDRFYKNGYPTHPVYRLVSMPVSETVVEIGIDKDDNASRAQMRQSVHFKLIRITDNKELLKRTARATTGYNILLGQFTTFVTENDARKQGLNTLADNITTQLELYFNH